MTGAGLAIRSQGSSVMFNSIFSELKISTKFFLQTFSIVIFSSRIIHSLLFRTDSITQIERVVQSIINSY